MGLVKQWMIEQAEDARDDEFRAWFKDKHGRNPTKKEMLRDWDDFELDEALEHAMSKDD